MSEAKYTIVHDFIGINPSEKDAVRFWQKVAIKGDDDCWEWLASKVRGGYGQFWIHGEQVKSHRVAWIITNGEIPAGKIACHKCDNPGCCNPNHLFIGSYKDNAVDRTQKGRGASGDRNGARLYPERLARGTKNHAATIDEQTVRLLRFVYGNGGYTVSSLSRAFDIPKSTLDSIIKKRTWAHI